MRGARNLYEQPRTVAAVVAKGFIWLSRLRILSLRHLALLLVEEISRRSMPVPFDMLEYVTRAGS